MVGLMAKSTDPTKNNQSAALVRDVKKKNALPMTKHEAAPKSTIVLTTWYRQKTSMWRGVRSLRTGSRRRIRFHYPPAPTNTFLAARASSRRQRRPPAPFAGRSSCSRKQRAYRGKPKRLTHSGDRQDRRRGPSAPRKGDAVAEAVRARTAPHEDYQAMIVDRNVWVNRWGVLRVGASSWPRAWS